MSYNGADLIFPHLGIVIQNMHNHITLPGGFTIAYYGIIIGIGMLLALFVIERDAIRHGCDPGIYYDYFLIAITTGVIGARIYYVIFQWEYYRGDLLKIINIRQGGLAIYGGILAALIYNKFVFTGDAVPLVLELPNYRLPSPRSVAQLLWEKAKDFLQKAFSVILIATVVVWFLSHFDARLNLLEDSSQSILSSISGLLVPLLAPAGLGDWRIATSLISGFMAKESVVAVMRELFGGTTGVAGALSALQAACMLVFSLLYTPCVAAVASIKRELGGLWALGVVVGQCAIAWVVTLVLRLVFMAMGLG